MISRAYSLFHTEHIAGPADVAAAALAAEQHAPGVICRMNPKSFRVEYIRPDGSKVPGYKHFLKLAMEG